MLVHVVRLMHVTSNIWYLKHLWRKSCLSKTRSSPTKFVLTPLPFCISGYISIQKLVKWTQTQAATVVQPLDISRESRLFHHRWYYRLQKFLKWKVKLELFSSNSKRIPVHNRLQTSILKNNGCVLKILKQKSRLMSFSSV